MTRTTLWICGLIIMISSSIAMAANTHLTRPFIGINYFAGWWEPQPNKWFVPEGHDWRPDYPDRIPILGQYNTQECMDKEIIAAAEHGVDFFNILWYYNDPGSERAEHTRLLNVGLETFLSSPNSNRMAFMIEGCNHPPFTFDTEEQWRDAISTWLKAFAHPSYLRIDGKLVFKLHSGHHFIVVECNRDLEVAKKRIDILREAVRGAGLGEMLIGVGSMSQESLKADHPLVGLFDFTNTYMDVPPETNVSPESETPKEPANTPNEGDYSYEEIAGFAHKGRMEAHANDLISYIPYLPSGWNPRPWHDPRPKFALPTRDQWKAALKQMDEDLKTNSALGLKSASGEKIGIFTIYAWNEFGEGGFVAPTQGDQYMKLDTIFAVFGPQRWQFSSQ